MKVHVTRITVEWAHCDAAGIVFYPYFYFWFDGGTERLFKANRLSYPELRRDFGVEGMRARAKVLGATLTIDSAVGSGTRISVSLPL